MALIVFDKCITLYEDEVHGTLVTTSIVYNYEFIDDFGDPTLGKFGKFLLNKVLPARSKPRPYDSSVVVKNDPASPENGDIELQSLEQNNLVERRDTIDSVESTLDGQKRSTLDVQGSFLGDRRTTLADQIDDFEPSLVTERWGPKDFDKDHHTLALMVTISSNVFKCL